MLTVVLPASQGGDVGHSVRTMQLEGTMEASNLWPHTAFGTPGTRSPRHKTTFHVFARVSALVARPYCRLQHARFLLKKFFDITI
jgi:hypothetical protein